MNAPDGPEENLSLAAMIRAMQQGEQIDKDALREALLEKGVQLGIPRKELARLAGRARWEAERKAEGRDDS